MPRLARPLTLFGALLLTAALTACGGGGGGGGGGSGSSGDGSSTGNSPFAVTNVADNGVLHSGFLAGTAEDGTTAVQVSVDSGAYTSATGTTAWRYKLPTGASTWHEGTQHTVAVKETTASGDSSPITLTVRKGRNQDIDGDGFAEVVVGADDYNSQVGRVYVFLSSGSAKGAAPAPTDAETIIDGETGSNLFGNAVAVGDFNGDGYADLAVGAFHYNSQKGRVYVFNSSGTAGITATAAGSADVTIDGEASTSNHLGSALAAGDVTCDGYDDLVAGAPGYASSEGRAYVFNAVAGSGITATAAGSADALFTGENTGNQFGTAVAAGDVTGDGCADVIVGAIQVTDNANISAGRIYQFTSAGSGGVSTTAAASADVIVGGEAASDRLGSAIAVGDVTGDGIADVATVSLGYNSGAGRVYVFHGVSGTGINASTAASADDIVDSAGSAAKALGTAIALGDVNGDGYDDLIASANYNSTSNTGRVHVIQAAGDGSGITATSAASADATILAEGNTDDFGTALTAGRVSGTVYADVIVGGYVYPGSGNSKGRVYLFHSTGTGGITAAAASAADGIFTGEANLNQFGWAVGP